MIYPSNIQKFNNKKFNRYHNKKKCKLNKNNNYENYLLLKAKHYIYSTISMLCFFILLVPVKPCFSIDFNDTNIIVDNLKISETMPTNQFYGAMYNEKKEHFTKNIEITQQFFQRRKILEVNNPEIEYDYAEDDKSFEENTHTINNTGKGKYIGAPCDLTCDDDLQHVVCEKKSGKCICDRNYPVIIAQHIGCAKPKKLGEQCFYHETCIYNDANSLCMQVNHNALCQCISGFHSVNYTKPKRIFCTQDMAVLVSDLPTLLGVTTGIAVLAGLICMVLHLFSKTKYPRHRNFADANLPPPIMYSSDTGMQSTLQSVRPSSHSSLHSSGSIGSYGKRRISSTQQNGSKGVLVSTSRTGAARSAAILLISYHISTISKKNPNIDRRNQNLNKHLQKELIHQRKLLHLELPPTKSNNKLINMLGMHDVEKNNEDQSSLGSEDIYIGALPTPASETARFATDILTHEQYGGSRRPSLASVHSTSSSIRSYGMMRFEKEIQQKETRQEMKLRLAGLQQQHCFIQSKPQIIVGNTKLQSGISPITPISTDELLPVVDEIQ